MKMTKREKTLLVIGVGLVILLLFLLRRSPASAQTLNQPISFGGVQIPGVDLPPRPPIAVTLDGLPTGSQYDFGGISTCMCDGSVIQPSGYNGPLISYSTTINEANNGPNIYNYTNTAPQTNPFSMFADGTGRITYG